jgi:hypothetical protein
VLARRDFVRQELWPARWHHVVRDVEQTADHRSAIVAEPAAADIQDRQQDEWQHAPGIPAHPDGDLVIAPNRTAGH